MNLYKSRQAFTLSEVLITLGIIGIIVALTLPNIIADYRDKADVMKVKQAYSLISQALNSAIAKNGDITSWNNISNVRNYLATEMQVIEKYGDTANLYKYEDFKSLNGNQIYNSLLHRPGYRTKNGMVFMFGTFFNYIENCANTSENGYCAIISIDINGTKGPNRYGFDVFELSVNKNNKISVYGADIKRCNPIIDVSTDGHPNGQSCISWILQEGNMNYKKCLRGNEKYCNINYNKYK